MIFPFSDEQKAFIRKAFDVDPDTNMDDDEQLDFEEKVSEHLQTHGINDAGDSVNDIGAMCEDVLTVIAKNS